MKPVIPSPPVNSAPGLPNPESLGDEVQMVYMDPPYGVKFGSNFQPFIRERDVNHNDYEDMTRKAEITRVVPS
jgi:hypothetical protein